MARALREEEGASLNRPTRQDARETAGHEPGRELARATIAASEVSIQTLSEELLPTTVRAMVPARALPVASGAL